MSDDYSEVVPELLYNITFKDQADTTLEKIVGPHIPMGLLRILNDNGDVAVLKDKRRHTEAQQIYKSTQSGYMNGCLTSKGQWQYLKRLYRHQVRASSAVRSSHGKRKRQMTESSRPVIHCPAAMHW